jgi:flavodoxin
VVYESKYGNTRSIGEAIAEVLLSDGSLEVTISRIGAADLVALEGSDLIVVGSPNHGGTCTRTVKHLLKRMARMDLEGKRIVFFDTCIRGSEGVAVRNMAARVDKAGCRATLLTPGLSVVVKGMRGPLAQGALDEARGFARRIMS